MSTLVLTSASGAPGVTTTALGLTLAWPEPCLLVDADRAASQAVLAGHLRGEAATAGVEALLQAHRERTSLAAALEAAERPLPEAPGARSCPASPTWVPSTCSSPPGRRCWRSSRPTSATSSSTRGAPTTGGCRRRWSAARTSWRWCAAPRW